MDALELRKKWIEALRSGKYKQGSGALRSTNDCFCCLGVLCDVIDPTKWESKKTPNGWDTMYYEGNPSTLSGKIENDMLIQNVFNFVYLNDIDHLSFEQIAGKIETDQGELFVTLSNF